MEESAVHATLLTLADLAARLRISTSTVNRLRKTDPDFPKPVRLSGPASRHLWRPEDVDAYLATARPVR
jgi:predicted DNA-binding transcriptional regulator AlpA